MAKKATAKKSAANRCKMEAANEVGVSLKKNGSNKNLTAAEAGAVGGQMVKKMVKSYKGKTASDK